MAYDPRPKMALLPFLVPSNHIAARYKSLKLAPFSSLVGIGQSQIIALETCPSSDAGAVAAFWSDVETVLRDFERELTQAVAPYTFQARNLRFEEGGKLVALQILSEGHFSHCHMLDDSNRAIVYEGALNSAAKEFDWDAPAVGRDVDNMYLKVYASACFKFSRSRDKGWKLETFERGKYPLVFNIKQAFCPHTVKILPGWGDSLSMKWHPWCHALAVSGDGRVSQYRSASDGVDAKSRSAAVPLKDNIRPFKQRVTEDSTWAVTSGFGNTQLFGGPLAAASAAVLQSVPKSLPANTLQLIEAQNTRAQHDAVLQFAKDRKETASKLSPDQRRHFLFGNNGCVQESPFKRIEVPSVRPRAGLASGPIRPLRIRMQALELNIARNEAQLRNLRPHLDEALKRFDQESNIA